MPAAEPFDGLGCPLIAAWYSASKSGVPNSAFILIRGDDEKVLGKSPKSITLLRLNLYALGQRFVQLLQTMVHYRTLRLSTLSFRDFFRRDVDADNVSVMTFFSGCQYVIQTRFTFDPSGR